MKHLGGSGGGGGEAEQQEIADISFTSDDTVEINLALGEGPIAGPIDGPRSFFVGDTPLESSTGEPNFNPFELHFYHGDTSPSVIQNVLGGVGDSQTVGVNLSYDVPVVRETPPEVQGEVDVIELRFLVNNLQRQDGGGDIEENTLNLDIEIRQVGESGWMPFFEEKRVTKKARLQNTILEYRRKVPRVYSNWEIRVRKADMEDDETDIADVTWESFQWSSSTPRSYENLSIVRVLSSANEQLRSTPQLSGIYAGMIVKVPSNYDPVTRHYAGTWDGSWKQAFTDNPVWVLYDLLMNPFHGAKRHFPALKVDRFSFYSAAQWCDELVPRPAGGYQPRYTFNQALTNPRGGLETLEYVAGIFGGKFAEDLAGTVILKVDRPGNIEQFFGPESVTKEGFRYQYTDVESRPNSAEVRFLNANLNFEEDFFHLDADPYIARNGLNRTDFDAVGCIDKYEAQRRARLKLIAANTEVVTVTFGLTRQALTLSEYSVIGIADPTQNWGLTGRIARIDGTTLHLRDPLTLPTGNDLRMVVQGVYGPIERKVRAVNGSQKQLILVDGELPSGLPDRPQFVIEDDEGNIYKPFRVLSIKEDGEDSSQYTVQAVEINPDKHTEAETEIMDPGDGTGSDLGDDKLANDFTGIYISSGTSELVRHADGRIESRIRVGWNPVNFRTVEIEYRRLKDSVTQTITAKTNNVYIPNVRDGQKYSMVLRGLDAKGREVKSTQPFVHKVIGKTAKPAKPEGWVGIPGIDTIQLTGYEHPDTDFAAFRIYASDNYLIQDNLVAVVSANAYTRTPPPGDTYTRYRITAVDTTGNESDPTDFISVTPIGTSLVQDEFDRLNALADDLVEQLQERSVRGFRKDLFDTTVQNALSSLRGDMETVMVSGNGRFQAGWTGWATTAGITMDMTGQDKVEVGILTSEDGGTAYREYERLEILKSSEDAKAELEQL